MKFPVPLKGQPFEAWGRVMADLLEREIYALQTKGGTVTLNANATTTTISNGSVTTSSVIVLSPTTSNAAGAVANVYVSSLAAGSATLTHANAATTDRTFSYVVL